jgi:hypothetical protein
MRGDDGLLWSGVVRHYEESLRGHDFRKANPLTPLVG